MRRVAPGLLRAASGMAVALCLVLSSNLTGAEAKTIKFAWTSTDSPTDPYGIVGAEFKKNLEELTNSELEVQLFPNRQLGDEKEILEGIRFGTIEAGVVTNAVVANVHKPLQVNDMPFLYPSAEVAHRILDGELGQELLAGLEDKGIIGLRFCEGGFRSMINNVRPVTQPSDVEGVKYRVMQNPVYIGMFSSLGGNAVPMAWGEVFPAVQQGALDGLEIPIMIIDATKYYEVTKYLSLTNHTYSAILALMSKRIFDGLTPEQQSAVREAAVRTCDTQRARVAETVEATIKGLGEKGMEVNQVEDVAPFREKVKPVYEQFREEIGSDRLDSFLAAVN